MAQWVKYLKIRVQSQELMGKPSMAVMDTIPGLGRQEQEALGLTGHPGSTLGEL